MEYKLIIITALSFGGGFLGSMMSGGSLIIFSILTFLNVPTRTAVGTLKLVIAGLTFISSLTYIK